MLRRIRPSYIAAILVMTFSSIAYGRGGFAAGAGAVAEGASDMDAQLQYNRILRQQAELRAIELRRAQREEVKQRARLQMLHEVNSNVPKMIDSGTRLDRAIYDKGVFAYFYTLLNIETNQLGPEVRQNQYARLRHNVCSNAGFREMLIDGDGIGYVYRDRYGVNAMQFVIRAADCMGN